MLPPAGVAQGAPREDSRVIGEREADVRREKGGFWIAFCAVFFYPTGWLAGRSRFEGLEHIPARGGALVVANHLSHLDPVFSGLIVHRARRGPRVLAQPSPWGGARPGPAPRGPRQDPGYPRSPHP